MNTGNRTRRLRTPLRSVALVSLALICALPLYYVVISSFKESFDMIRNPLSLPETWTFENYRRAFEDGTIVRAFINTLIVTAGGVSLQLLIGSLAAYGMIIRDSRLTVTVGALLVAAFAIPSQALLIPQYKLASMVGLTDSLLGLIVLYTGGAVFAYFLIVGYMRKVPGELFEAAKIDGARPLRIYWTIVLPVIRPILVTVVVFQTMSTWNDFVTPRIYISSREKQTVVLQVYNAVQQFSTDWPLFMAITVAALLPVLIFFIFCQRWILSGLVAGSVKQ